MAQIQPVRRQSFSNSYALFDTAAKPVVPGAKVAAANLVVEEAFEDDDDDDESDDVQAVPMKGQAAKAAAAKQQQEPKAVSVKTKANAPAESPETTTAQLGRSPTDKKEGWWFQDVRELRSTNQPKGP
ncbi:uncharacterized protein LOC62_02G003016 [Vanrija pseudolonga]|uniref:Uncharacterized protein n=1 Tax=Vanrija pseudolonga TaxID=143232 RepID=A0AAF0Y9K4_9TREE|nr:hypothetical protein LOC62_02G003016 [Vanrija pseudolonga]